MKTLITYLIVLIFLALCASCSSKSDRLAKEKTGYAVEYVLFSGKFEIVNDSIARMKRDINPPIYKKKAQNGEYRYYLVE